MEPAPVAEPLRDPRKVAVMHGRDLEARGWMFDWLRRIGLDPLEWGELVDLTGRGAPYNGEAVAAAFEAAQAVVVLFTPDEIAALHPDLDRGGNAPEGQARANVILEAGMALQSHPVETILVEIGSTRAISDLAGRNAVRLDGHPAGLNALASRLKTAGCPVRRDGSDWLDTSVLERLGAHGREVRWPAAAGGIVATAVEESPYRVFRIRDSRLEERLHHGTHWLGWSEIGTLKSKAIGLAASSLGSGHVEVFVLLEDGEVLHTWWRDDDGWQSVPDSLGRPFGGEPVSRITAASQGEGHQEVFVEAASGAIGHIWYLKRHWRRSSDPSTGLGDGWRRFG